jgi:hypothetical protein
MNDPRFDAYTVCWMTTLDCELVAARLFLDKEHADLPTDRKDPNSYILGEMGINNVVIAFTPQGQYGIVSIANTVANMSRTFRQVRCVLLVGVGGGAPGKPNERNPLMDIRLGDVVVSCPDENEGKPGPWWAVNNCSCCCSCDKTDL